jgi:hypothetical protein
MAQRARELGVIRSAHHTAAQLLHACNGLDVALHGSAPDVLAGETHVDVVAEDAMAEHLAELVLGVHDALHGSLTYPSRSIAEISFGTRIATNAVCEHTQGVLSPSRAVICWDSESFQRSFLHHFTFRTVLLIE